MPSWAAPKPSPAKPPSEIGVLMTRSGNRSGKPLVAPYAPPPRLATSSPNTMARGSRSSQRPVTAAMASE